MREGIETGNVKEDEEHFEVLNDQIIYRVHLYQLHHYRGNILGTLILSEIEKQEDISLQNDPIKSIPVNRVRFNVYVGRKNAGDEVSIRDCTKTLNGSHYWWPIAYPEKFFSTAGYAVFGKNGMQKEDYQERLAKMLKTFTRTVPKEALDSLFEKIDSKIALRLN